jgi:Uncharacterised protein conserved in bacteria (DUF2336)
MNKDSSYLAEIDQAITRGTAATRLQALWHATDLLIAGQYSDDQIWVFGELISRLAVEIEEAARIQLAKRLARVDRAPANILNELAHDDRIDVAGPVLKQAHSLGADCLVQAARTKSTQHLLAISQRKSIPAEVTDVLVVRGNNEVAQTVAGNAGATFSNSGFLHLVKRSGNDTILAENLGKRVDVPRHIFQQLIAKASDETKRKLQRERPDLALEIKTTVTDATGKLHLKFGPASKDYFVAKRLVGLVHQHGHLNEAKMSGYAEARKVDEVVVGLSLLCGLPVNVTERALMDVTVDLLLVLTRAIGFSWATTMSFLFLGARDHRISSRELESKKHEFDSLSEKAARSILEFYQSRKSAAAVDEALGRLPQLHMN